MFMLQHPLCDANIESAHTNGGWERSGGGHRSGGCYTEVWNDNRQHWPTSIWCAVSYELWKSANRQHDDRRVELTWAMQQITHQMLGLLLLHVYRLPILVILFSLKLILGNGLISHHICRILAHSCAASTFIRNPFIENGSLWFHAFISSLLRYILRKSYKSIARNVCARQISVDLNQLYRHSFALKTYHFSLWNNMTACWQQTQTPPKAKTGNFQRYNRQWSWSANSEILHVVCKR